MCKSLLLDALSIQRPLLLRSPSNSNTERKHGFTTSSLPKHSERGIKNQHCGWVPADAASRSVNDHESNPVSTNFGMKHLLEFVGSTKNATYLTFKMQ